MSIRHVTLSGEMLLSNVGYFACIKNKGAGNVLACAKQGLTEGDDGTLTVPSGETVIFPCIDRSLVLNGNGEVVVVGNDTPVNFFKPSSADGGVTKEYVDSTRFSPNLLINPDFAINQRGKTVYTTTGYTVDRWFMQVGFEITPLENGIRICPTGAVTSNLFAIYQNIPVSKAMFGSDHTLTVNVSATNDYAYAVAYAYNSANAVIKSSDKIKLHTGLNSTTIRNIPDSTAYIRVQFTINSGAQTSDILEIAWVKLEQGSVAAPYTTPDPAAEMMKCQRYYQIRSTGDIPAADLRPVMAGTPKVTQRADGTFEYIV